MFPLRVKTPQLSAITIACLDRRLWFIGLGISLIALHLTLLWRVGLQVDDLFLNGAFWLALYPKLKRRYQQSETEPSAIAFCIGTLLIGCIFLRCTSLYWFEASFAKLMPLLIMLGLGLMISGRGIYRYWPELFLMIPLAIPRTLTTNWMSDGAGEPLQTATAALGSFVLHYLGFSVSNHQTTIVLPQGSVEVQLACTVFPSLLVLLQLSVLLGALLPIGWKQQTLVLAIAVSLAGAISIVRVSFLALTVNHPALFEFWHGAPGKQIISTALIVGMLSIHHAFYRQDAWEEVEDA